MSSTNAEFTSAIIASVLSSGGLWGTAQYVMRRKERKDDTNRRADTAREDRARKEREREELLADSRATAQVAAIESWDRSYKRLETEYESCRRVLGEVRNAAGLLIDVLESVMFRLRPVKNGEAFTATLQPDEVIKARESIVEARQHLLYFTDWKVPMKDDGL